MLEQFRLFQLTSPSLPVGAFAYSQGLEYAVEAGWIENQQQAMQWIQGVIEQQYGYWDIPIGKRLYLAWQAGDAVSLNRWNAMLYASRESDQIQRQEDHLARSIEKIIVELDTPAEWVHVIEPPRCYLSLYMGAMVHWNVQLQAALAGYLWSCLENLTMAAIKLIPLGQNAGQKILFEGAVVLNQVLQHGMSVSDQQLGQSMPGYQMALVLHESMYSRLFRS